MLFYSKSFYPFLLHFTVANNIPLISFVVQYLLLLLIVFLLYDFRALFQKNDVADYEATAFSIFYNNALFLVIVVLLSFYLLKGFSTTAYPFEFIIKIIYENIGLS